MPGHLIIPHVSATGIRPCRAHGQVAGSAPAAQPAALTYAVLNNNRFNRLAREQIDRLGRRWARYTSRSRELFYKMSLSEKIKELKI